MSDLQSNLAEFIRRLGVDDDRLDQLERRTTALGQGIRNLWTDGTGKGSMCVTTISGTILGGHTTTPLPGATIQVTGYDSGISYGTFTATDGTYSLALILDATDTALSLVVTGPGPRFTAKAPVIVGVTKCAVNSLSSIQAVPATGYYYLAGANACPFPIGATLNYDHSLHGTGTMVFSATPAWITPCLDVTSFAAGSCVSVNTVFRLLFQQAMTLVFAYRTTLVCPIAAACPTGTTANGSLPATITAKQCPSLTDKFDITYTIAGGTEPLFHGPADQTFRLYEP